MQEKITIGGGCFWCIEGAFSQLKGIHSAVSGYANGTLANPSYEAVCTGETGHAEVVQLTYDAENISLTQILEIFYTLHDPTQLNRQGNDIGSQYRGAIYWHNEVQQAVVAQFVDDLRTQQVFNDEIVTELAPLKCFYPAEDYHQDYFPNNPDNTYCQFVVGPKLIKFRETHRALLKETKTSCV